MKKILSLIISLAIIFPSSLIAVADEFSSSAEIDYGYDSSYDETKRQEITTEKSDKVNTSYDKSYDEGTDSDISSSKYDDKEQSYNKEFDERVTDDNVVFEKPNDIKVFHNGKQLKFDVQPMLINNRTMVPMRAIFEALDAEVNWDDTTQTAIGETKKTTVKITIGKDYLLKNDNIVVLDSPAVIVSGRTLVPVRAIAESLDCKVEWYGETQVVEILK